MSRRRVWLVHALLVVMVGGHLHDLATGREHWPFSPYPMYAHAAREWSVVVPLLVGVRRDGGELPLRGEAYLAPFDQSRLLQALGAILLQTDGRERASVALRDCLARYERRRVAHEHDGPALGALRYYHETWALDREARNVERPERQDLVLEVAAPGAQP